ncbi:MAG: transketolase [Clostridia bacterium]|nr:transketolase [Clostridia bacterium]
MDKALLQKLKVFAAEIRIGTLEAIGTLGFGHLGGSLSIADALAVLYGAVMRVDPDNPGWPERDKFVCSKGHAGPAVYATLGLKGYFPYEDIRTLNKPGTNFPSHCDRKKTPGIDMTTGSLGQGASLAVGLALGDRLKGRSSRCFLMLGDGEINEGQVWEAAELASSRRLNNLYVFIDNNKKQLDGYVKDILDTGDIAYKFASFGFDTQRINGNDAAAIYEAIQTAAEICDRPHAIVLDTIKGAGVAEVENTVSNHSMNITREQADGWIAALRDEIEAMGGKPA